MEKGKNKGRIRERMVRVELPETRYSVFYLTVTAISLLDGLCRKQGLRRNTILENIIRKEAKEEGVSVPQ
jgi:hypothetical protein